MGGTSRSKDKNRQAPGGHPRLPRHQLRVRQRPRLRPGGHTVAEGHLHHRVCEAVLRRPGGLDLTGLTEGVERLPRGLAALRRITGRGDTLQEYFEKLRTDPARWGKPFQALLGALDAQLDYGAAAIGGKDSIDAEPVDGIIVCPEAHTVAEGHLHHRVCEAVLGPPSSSSPSSAAPASPTPSMTSCKTGTA